MLIRSKNSRLANTSKNHFALSEALDSDDPEFVDFISKCLRLDPEIRFTAEMALSHPWLAKGGHI